MDNAYLEIDGKEVEVLIDNGGGIDGFMINGWLINMRTANPSSRFILEHMVELQEEAGFKIMEWERTHIMSRAYYGEG